MKTKWEYWVVNLDAHQTGASAWVEALDNQGKQGWELVNVFERTFGEGLSPVYAVFKRVRPGRARR